jgi:RasGEF domain/RasGEF N-terminal motif
VSKSKDLLLNISSRPPVIESGDEDSDETEDGIEIPAPLKTKLRVDTSNLSRSQGRPTGPQTPISSEELTTSQLISPSEPAQSAIPETPESYYVKSMLRPPSADTVDSRAFQTFLNMEEESHDDAPNEVTSAAKAIQKLTVEDTPAKDSGVSFQDLVERLLCLPASKQDSKFVPSFLCLYRMFATPKQLLVAIIDQFMKTEKSTMVRFTKVAEMLRYLQVLGEWTARYPGDFAQPPARDIANTFVQSIEKSREFGAAAKELKNNLETYVPDDDLDWAYDDSPTSASSKESSGTKQKTPNSSSTSIPSSMTDSSLKLTPSRSFHREPGEGDDGSWNASSILRKGNSSQSYLNVFQLEHAREEAKRLRPDPHLRLSKIQWHQFMEIPVELLAREITRIDWTTYSSIRPRDYVRHVVLSEHKRRSRRGDNISLMVRQFNHLALFVSGMILLRDKPKHRARALEKFMALAWKVRQLNNYNSLGAIVAGINGHEIARLGQTRELVPLEVQKQFMRLTILMGISRSHAAYRMAWENSFAERIPFLPLLRQDLTMSASANQTFVGSNVNWQKFKIMGDAIVGVLGSLEHPYSFPNRTSTSDHVVSLLLQTKILEESEVRCTLTC